MFHVGCGSGYVYGVKRNQAEAICKNFNADLATKVQMDAATKDGASWCSCGWVKDDEKNAYYPGTGQKGCGANNQIATCASRDDNYCVNCYGVKPDRDDDSTTLKADISLGRRGDMTVLPFNIQNNWSEWGYGGDVAKTKTTAQMKSVTLEGWEHAV